MSLLLKALEKSEEEKKEGGETEATGAPVPEGASGTPGAAPGGGFKLSGGSAAAGSKLGSALGAAEQTAARKVVAAHAEEPAGHEEDAVADELARASRRGLVRNMVMMAVAVAVVGAGWYAWQTFSPQFLPQPQVEQEAPVSEEVASVAPSDATLLPLSEPIYDIQESISLTSARVADSAAESEQDIQEQVAEVVTNIIESQLEQQRAFIEEQQRIIAAEAGESDLLGEEIDTILAEEFDPATATEVTPYGYEGMVAQLEALSDPYVAKGGRQYVKPAGVDVSELAATNGNGAAENANGTSEAASAKEVMVLAKTHTDLREVFEDAMASYKAGDLNHAEQSFRTVIAAEPRNTGALLGLAKVHQSRGNIRIAVATLLKAAEIAPNDPVVIGELVSIQSGSADPVVSESRILSLLAAARDPQVEARLRFLLGNSYAMQENWARARESFLIAHGLEQANPDFAYNLAVVMDYLNEPENAARMYRTALSSAAASPSSFDHQVARSRLAELTR